ncbi:hypothetical protein BHE74_00005848 [Ensete ventricosum]|nr:hypothetical protein GW17_00021162 [Ensete ventricosum]RWW85460.1 hypothetical protein BHE74_00005848 [Ensete ventricosum]RZR90855.1 hypothetical protein BHM03_00018832 [Ensete ventricosum]
MIRNHMPGDRRTVVGASRKRATGRRGHHPGRRSPLYFVPRVGSGLVPRRPALRPRAAGPLVVPPLEQDRWLSFGSVVENRIVFLAGSQAGFPSITEGKHIRNHSLVSAPQRFVCKRSL